MTGPLNLSADPTSNLQAATKQFVDAETVRATNAEAEQTASLNSEIVRATGAETALTNSKISKAGDSMTGLLTLSGDPVTSLQAATKQYVDTSNAVQDMALTTKVSKSGDSMSGGLVVSVTGGVRGIDVLTTGGGGAGVFQTNTTSEPASAALTAGVIAGNCAAISAGSSGTQEVARFVSNNPNNANSALYVEANTLGNAATFQIRTATSTASVLNLTTLGLGTGLTIDHRGASGDIATLQNSGVTVAKIDKTGRGSFSGGIEVTNIGGGNTFAAEARPLNTGASNTFAGTGAGASNTTGASNTFVGRNLGRSNLSAVNNTFVGESAGDADVDGGNNTFIGTSAGYKNVSGSGNTFVGRSSGYYNATGNGNTFVGENAGSANSSATANTFIGNAAGAATTSGQFNTFAGLSAGLANTLGEDNAFFGVQAGFSNTIGVGNTALGTNSGNSISTGNNNIAIGSSTAGGGNSLTTGDNNIAIGNPGVAAESNTIRIGRVGTQTATFIAGINGITSSGGTSVFINASGKLGTLTSSRRFKDNIKDMGASSALLLKLRPVTFTYKKDLDTKGVPQWGLIAEEVAAVNPEWVVRDEKGEINTVRYEQINAMLLNEFLKQHNTVVEQATQIRAIEMRIRELCRDVQKTVPQ